MALVVLIGTLLSLLLSFVLSPVLSPLALVASGSAYLMIIIQGALSLAITALISGALISMVNSIEEGQTVSVSRGIQAGLRRLVPLFFVTLALQIPLWLVAFLQTGSLLFAFASSGQPSLSNTNALFSTGILYGVFSLVVSLVSGAIGVGAERATVLESQSVFAALKAGWNLLWRKLKDFIAIGLIFLLLVILLALAYFLVVRLIGSVLLGGIFVIIGIVFSLFATVFESSVWTLAFREWQAQERGELSVATEGI